MRNLFVSLPKDFIRFMIKKNKKKLAWPIFAPIAFMLWTIDYYLVYFGLSFFFYKLTSEGEFIQTLLDSSDS